MTEQTETEAAEAASNLTPEMQSALENLLALADLQADGDITANHVTQAVEALKRKLATPATGGGSGTAQAGEPSRKNTSFKNKRVLIAGQLGIITHQLKQNIGKVGGTVTIARGVDDVMAEYQKDDYALVIIDLFMPTDREGLYVLEEIKRLSLVCNISTDIVVLAPPVKDRNLREVCRSKGASVFLEKGDGWHKQIIQYFLGEGEFGKDS